VDLMRRIQFGRIEGLVVRDGEPVLNPQPRVVRELKFPLDEHENKVVTGQDFELKRQVLDLFKLFDRVREGTLLWLEIKAGLPFRLALEDGPPLQGMGERD